MVAVDAKEHLMYEEAAYVISQSRDTAREAEDTAVGEASNLYWRTDEDGHTED
jgi:hypothetical protein